MKTSFVIFVIFALAKCSAEEIETRKPDKNSNVESNNVKETRTEVPENTAAVEMIKETTLAAPAAGSESPAPPSTNAPSTTTVAAPEIALSSSSTQTPTTESTTTERLEEEDLSDEIAAVDFPVSMVMEVKPDTPSTSESTSSFEAIDEDDISSSSETNNVIPLGQNPKRKVIYVNQQQNGKLNVQLELSDVSVIVIPNQRDPQLSLLNLLFKSAQKSNEVKKKDEGELNDEYSKYKLPVRPAEDSFNFGSSNMPLVESRAPYKVDISSTMGQQSQPAVDISPNGHQHSIPQQQFQPQFARSPIMQLLKPIPFTIHPAPGQLPQSNRIFKRSLGSRMLITDDGIPGDGENSVNDDLTESILNTFDNDDDLNGFDESDGSEFVLLGATENCGPGRKRNSYQVCVSDPNWDSVWE